MSTVCAWTPEPTRRWVPCSCGCGRSGRWMLEVLGHPTGGPVCRGCRAEMERAYVGARTSGTKGGRA